MTTYVLLLVLSFAPHGRDTWTLDYNLTQEDCATMLAETPAPYQHGTVTVSYACEIDAN